MIRTSILALSAAALLGGTALAQPAPNAASAPPSNLSNSARNAPDYDEDDYDAPPVSAAPRNGGAPDTRAQTADDRARRDMFCRRDAAARTGYTTPGEAARDAQARGSIGGTLGGAALGAIIGAGAGNAGLGAAAGAGAGLLAGSAIGSNNAREAARNVEDDYASAYWGCMNQDYRGTAPGRSAYGPPRSYDDDYGPPPPPVYAYGPPPPAYYYPAYGYPYYGPAYGPSYGPGISFGFGFGGGGYRGGHGGWRGGHGGGRHR